VEARKKASTRFKLPFSDERAILVEPLSKKTAAP
jgi:hypothetical protein